MTATLRYKLAENTIDEQDLKGLIDWLGTNPWLTQGPLVREFESRWASWVGTPHALFVNSGSSANLLMFYAALLSPRLTSKTVVVPAVSWATSVAPALQLGMDPVMCEAEPRTFGVDPDALAAICASRPVGAVVVVHVLGVPVELEPILALQRRYGFLLLEDACAATGSRYDGRAVGTFGDLSSFSFFFGHHLSTIEGGMVCTPHRDLQDLLLQARSHGWAKDMPPATEASMADAERPVPFNRPFTFYIPGFNLRSTDLNARLGLAQLDKADRVVARRAENHALYQKKFTGAPGFGCQVNPRAAIASISFAALASSMAHRQRVGDALRAAGIETRPVGGGNMSRQPFWRARYGTTVYPVADRLHETAFQLPNHPGLSLDDIAHIADTALAVTP
ncbi:MAG TPA: DegT/DnrJ/EryC1/StrS family aminotransferase [Terriglobales bacterium]|nr:DegT/DnrJ/EryC1/StrS family aminotransferase [Terriglobales bacterium]